MNVDYVAKIEVPTTTLKQGSTDQYETVIGTGYPIRDGLLLTAWHVVFPSDRDSEKPIRIIWKREDESEAFHESKVTKIECAEEKFDVALLACDTTKLALPPSILADPGQFHIDGKRWKSHGYPTAGKERGIRIKNPAGGVFLSANPSHHIQWLNSDGNVSEDELWQGMSGAPVFDEKNKLVAIIVKTPADYCDEKGCLKPEYNERLLSVSLPYLLNEGKCPKFRSAIFNENLAENQLPGLKVKEAFEQWLSGKLEAELSGLKAKTQVLHEQLAEELGDSSGRWTNKSIVTALLDDCDFERSVDALAAASCDCLLEGGCRYSKQLPLELIRASVESILGWLVLQAIDEDRLQTLLPLCTHRSSLYFNLKSVQSLSGLEVVIARRFNRKPNFNNQHNSEQESKYRITLPREFFHWDDKHGVRKVFIEIWNQVFPAPKLRKEAEYQYTAADVRTLNSQLRKRRGHSRHPEHYYISFTGSDFDSHDDHVAFIAGIYQDLLSQLHEMTIIEYGDPEQESHLFVIPEEDVRTTIRLFYEEINGKLGNRI